MKIGYKSYMLLVASLLVASCSDSDKWEPGPQENDTMGVFFRELDKYDYSLEPDDNHIVNVTVGRIDSKDAATVPLKIVSCPEGVVVPESVSFDAGEEETSFVVDLTGMPYKTSGEVKLQIDPAFSTLYGEGSSVLEMNVTITGQWIVLADNLVIDYSKGTYDYPDQQTELLMLEGTQRFKIPDFMNSGVDFVFTVDDPTKSDPEIVPFTNCIWYDEVFPDEDNEYECWYLYDTANQTYPVWSPDGSEPKITYAMFYGLGYSYIMMKKGYGYFTIASDYDNGKSGWCDVVLTFDAKFDPFAE